MEEPGFKTRLSLITKPMFCLLYINRNLKLNRRLQKEKGKSYHCKEMKEESILGMLREKRKITKFNIEAEGKQNALHFQKLSVSFYLFKYTVTLKSDALFISVAPSSVLSMTNWRQSKCKLNKFIGLKHQPCIISYPHTLKGGNIARSCQKQKKKFKEMPT